MNDRFYRFILAIARFLVRLIYPIRATGLEHIPPTGGAIFCSNHISMLDPIMLAVASGRPTHFMAKVELFKPKWFGKFLSLVGAFPVKRGEYDMGALKTSLNVVKDGKVMGIFAQGHRDKTGDLNMESGVALIALRTGAPVVPVYMLGPYRMFRRFRVIFGQPVDLTQYGGKYNSELLKAATADIERSVRALEPLKEQFDH